MTNNELREMIAGAIRDSAQDNDGKCGDFINCDEMAQAVIDALTPMMKKTVRTLGFYMHTDYHFDAFSGGAVELFDDAGLMAKTALALLPECWKEGAR